MVEFKHAMVIREFPQVSESKYLERKATEK